MQFIIRKLVGVLMLGCCHLDIRSGIWLVRNQRSNSRPSDVTYSLC